MQNFTIPKPEVNPIIANMGYGFAACSILGFLLFIIIPASSMGPDFNPAVMLVPFIFFALGGAGPFLRYLIFARNPDDAKRLPQHEMDDIDQKMQGEWQIEYDAQQNNGIQCGQTNMAQDVDVANGNYTYTVYRKHRTQKMVRKLDFFRSPDGRVWFDTLGGQVYQLDLPNKIVMTNYIGQNVTWNRTSGGANMANQPPVYTNPNPPAYNPSAPPSYDSGTSAPPPVVSGSVAPSNQNNSGGKTIGEQLKELHDLEKQGILSPSEFETAKAKILA